MIRTVLPLALVAFSINAFAEDVKLAIVDFAPFSVQSKSGASGPAVEIARELGKRAQISMTEVNTDVPRMAKLNESEPAVYALVVKSPDRVNTYRWIGKLTDDHYCFMTMKPRKGIATLDAAKSAKSIGVNAGGAAKTVASGLGLTNLEEAMSNSGSARKLMAGRIDAWFVTSNAGASALKAEGVSPDKFECTGDFGTTSFWVGASKKMSEEQFAKLQKTYAEMEKEGYVKSTLSKGL